MTNINQIVFYLSILLWLALAIAQWRIKVRLKSDKIPKMPQTSSWDYLRYIFSPEPINDSDRSFAMLCAFFRYGLVGLLVAFVAFGITLSLR